MMTINNSNDSNPRRDWEDFWYNSKQIYPPESNTNYNELVDYQVSTMNTNSPYDDKEWTDNLEAPFNTEAYRNYRDSLTSKKRKSFDELYNEFSAMSIPEQITNLKQLGRDVVNKLDKIIDNLDVILEGEKTVKKDNNYRKDF